MLEYLKKLFHIHVYHRAGMTCKSAPGYECWSFIMRCRCGAEYLTPMEKEYE